MCLARRKQSAVSCAAILLFFIASIRPMRAAEPSTRQLVTGWTFRAVEAKGHAETEQWHPAAVPGVVQTDLLQAGLIPDPFFGDNEKQLQWIGLTDWEYQTEFSVDAATLRRKHIDLVFDGLDTLAEVTLNGHSLLHADNMFRTWRAEAKPLLKPGNNVLTVLFRSPINTMTPVVAALPYILPGTGFEAFDRDKGIFPVSQYLRKSPYQFGWDWAPKFVTQGIWRPVQLEMWDEVRIADMHIEQQSVSKAHVVASAELEIEASAAMKADLQIRVVAPDRSVRIVRQNGVTLDSGENHISIPLRIESPALWYPNGYGRQDRYSVSVVVADATGVAIARTQVKTGLRSVELRRDPDKWGTSFEFVINGIPLFAQGANVVPFDSFPSRVTLAQQRRILQSAHDSNLNLVRMWGGGYYESDAFYDLCDELGLMVWQEFIFGGAMVPGDLAFQNNVSNEAVEQAKRLRNHPSLVLWCGNNEVETAWTSWDDRKQFQKSITPDQRERVWQDYVIMFRDILKSAVTEYGNGVPYWSSSPSANFEDKADSYANGDMHYWNVWSGKGEPIEEYGNQTPRFMSEYGFQSMPDLRTVRAFAGDNQDLASAAMLNHERYVHGFDRMQKYLAEYYQPPRDFRAFVYLSQVMQAQAIKVAAEHLRSEMPTTMGSIYWQLNDCWPVASWSSIDYFGRWKALQYYVRRFYAPVLVAPVFKDGRITVHIVSNRQSSFPAELRLRLMDMHGKVLAEKRQSTKVAALGSTAAMDLSVADLAGFDPANTFAVVELNEGREQVARNVLYFARPREINLPAAHLTTEIVADQTGYAVRVSSNTLARDIAISFADLDAEPSDNYFDLLPGESVSVQIESKSSLAALKAAMHVMSLSDAITPTT
jgi:beta-mannosidase